MKKVLLAITAISLVLVQASFVLAEHSHEHLCEMLPTGHDFGIHVAEHAKAGHFSGEMNPGVHHKGYSICVPR